MGKVLRFPKPTREVNGKYLDFVVEHKCCACDNIYTITVHHTKTRGAGGSDYLTVPLCAKCHMQIEQVGQRKFCTEWNIDFNTIIINLLKGYIEEIRGVFR
jgi:hypothetical protein